MYGGQRVRLHQLTTRLIGLHGSPGILQRRQCVPPRCAQPILRYAVSDILEEGVDAARESLVEVRDT